MEQRKEEDARSYAHLDRPGRSKIGKQMDPMDQIFEQAKAQGYDVKEEARIINRARFCAWMRMVPPIVNDRTPKPSSASLRDISDMLEAPTKGHSILRLTGTEKQKPQAKPQKPAQQPQTKKQRQQRRKKEEKKEATVAGLSQSAESDQYPPLQFDTLQEEDDATSSTDKPSKGQAGSYAKRYKRAVKAHVKAQMTKNKGQVRLNDDGQLEWFDKDRKEWRMSIVPPQHNVEYADPTIGPAVYHSEIRRELIG
ncbi:MAG: hypothetical protein Q9174_006404, partial [Haloplaca sp. 1 TL-2023]